MTQTILNTPALAVEFMRHVAPDGVPVDSGVTPDIVARMPIAVVTTTAPRAVPNGPIGAGTYFRLNVSVFAGARTQAHNIAATMYSGAVAAWRAGWMGEAGWISRITTDSLEPQLVAGTLIADNVARFDFTLGVVARH